MAENTVALTDDNFNNQVIKSSHPVLVDFWAPWCSPCVAIAPTLEALAEEYKGRVTIGKMNVDENANIPSTYGVRSIPYLALFIDGEVVDSIVGSVPKARVAAMLDKVLV